MQGRAKRRPNSGEAHSPRLYLEAFIIKHKKTCIEIFFINFSVVGRYDIAKINK